MAFLGFSFSWRRALGISRAKSRLSREIGIPLSESGRQQKIGRMVERGGVGWPLMLLLLFGHRDRVVHVREHGPGCLGRLVMRAIVIFGLYLLIRHWGFWR